MKEVERKGHSKTSVSFALATLKSPKLRQQDVTEPLAQTLKIHTLSEGYRPTHSIGILNQVQDDNISPTLSKKS